MKTTSILCWLLVISLAMNVAMLGMRWGIRHPAPVASLAGQRLVRSSHTVRAVPPNPRAPASPEGAESPGAPFQWDQVESTDYRTYMANLRKLGCPEETIRDLIIADINRLYVPKLAAITSQHADFWKSGGGLSASERMAQSARLKELGQEKDSLLKELLGVDPRAELSRYNGFVDASAQKLDFLPEAKRQPVRQIADAYEEAQANLHAQAGGLMTTTDREELQRLEWERHRALLNVMTPGEVEEFELRDSATADRLRSKLTAFEPTESEYRALFRLQHGFDEQFGGDILDPATTPEAFQKRVQAQQTLDAQIQAALGKDRYADYQRSQDSAYSSLVELSQRYDLPKETAARIYEMKQIAEAQIAQVQAGANPQSPQTQEIITATGRQTVATVRAMLGEKAFNNYLQYSGFWLQRISP